MSRLLWRLCVPCLFAAACFLAASPAAPFTLADLRNGFLHPPDDARIMMRWWWFGPAVVKPELEREMRTMKEGGIGGFEVQPVYPLEVNGNFKYLSEEFLSDVQFTAAKAKELGMRMDMTLASGWPYGGPHIPLNEASGRLRVEVAKGEPKLKEGESVVASFPAGDSTRYFIESHTGQQVKRAAYGAEGPVLDHYSRAAIETHLKKVADPLMRATGPNPPHAVFSDSLEVYGADWTPNLLAEFQKRRGYDLKPYLPALAGDIGAKTAAIRHDWGRTLTELADENYLTPVREWAHGHGTLFRSQTYGTPPVTLSSNQYVDLPEGEGTQWRRFSATRWAASASHLYNRPVTSSETWTWLHSPVFRATPLDMKAEADLHFLQGINQLIGHGWPYSPPEAGEPGWRFYAAAVFNAHNPWWIVMPDVTRYLQRISYLLRQGRPANDVALYLPTDDAWASFTLGHVSINGEMDRLLGPNVVPAILSAGYNLDFIDDDAMAHGIPYPILVVPGAERMPAATLQRLTEYSKKGGHVIFTRRLPSLAPGLQEEGDTAKVRELAAQFSVTDEAKLGDALHAALAADVAVDPSIAFIHRKLDFADVYFVANTANHPVRSKAQFRVAGLAAEYWNPLTGEITGAGGTTLDLDLAPYESRIVVFSRSARPATPSAPAAAPVDISDGWTLAFPDAPPVALEKPKSWTELPDREYYSGVGVYTRTVNVPAGMLGRGRAVYLNFGEGTPVEAEGRRAGSGMRAMLDGPIREAAEVTVNGKRAGSIWCAPYEVNIGPYLHAGANNVKVEVANLALNRMAKGPLPDYRELTAKYGERFQAQDMQSVKPQPSGILGPVRLIAR
ncbi:MAG TPA: glycosyl hydrolase [Candidatus Limnocylindrales bacterium]|nr:glycosyl hydrolase [Candidatus Limnocylindrales bacterium]